jgi:S1-C subfamily serine protease
MRHVDRAISLAVGIATTLAGTAMPMRADAEAPSPAEMFARIQPSLALVIARDGKSYASGTAFCIGSRDGSAYLLTNKHVVGNDPSPGVVLWSDRNSALSAAVDRISLLDAVVLVVRNASCPALTLTKTPPVPGTSIGIAGFPSVQFAMASKDLSDLSPSFHTGLINSTANSSGLIEYDAQTDHGNSGSPLFDMQTGAVYGMVTFISTGQTHALQNNFALSVPTLASFLDHSHAVVAYDAATGAASTATATSPPSPVIALINAKCGAQTVAQLSDGLRKSFAELSGGDYPSASADARTTVEAATACAVTLPGCAGTACDDHAQMIVEGAQLMAAQTLRIATARMNGDTVNAERNEISALEAVCSSPNILLDEQPYMAARTALTGSLDTARKLYRVGPFRGALDVDGMRTCASKIGVSF